MNEDQTRQLLKYVQIMKNCMVTVTICALLLIVYDGFNFYKYNLAKDDFRQTGFNKELYRAGQKGDYGEMKRLCIEKLKAEPRNTMLLSFLAEAQFNLREWQECIDTWNRVLDISPSMKTRADPCIERAEAKLEAERINPQTTGSDSANRVDAVR